MGRFLLRRVALSLVALLTASVLIFALLRFLPGDIVNALIGTEGDVSPAVRETMRRIFGLDQPGYVQYVRWLGAALQGDLGTSFRTNQPVLGLLLARLPVTAELAGLAVLLSSVSGIALGVVASTRRGGATEVGARLVGLLGLSMPTFWTATLLILGSSIWLRWLPGLIYVSPLQDPLTNLQQMLLPALSLSLALTAVTTRTTRSAMLDVLRHDYVTVARAKGLSPRTVLMRHGLRNALIPVVTVAGIQLGELMGGAVVVEQIFGLPGMGWTLVNGIYDRDYPVVQGAVLLLTVSFLVISLLVDVSYSILDPRVRYG